MVPELPEPVAAAVAEARTKSAAVAQAQQEASAAMRAAVATLTEGEELTVRDAASILGVTHQRVSQLAS